MKSLFSSRPNQNLVTATLVGAVLFTFLTHGCSPSHTFALGSSTDAQEQSHNRIMRRWDNTIRGQETVFDPDTNTTWQVEAGHNYYFAWPTGY